MVYSFANISCLLYDNGSDFWFGDYVYLEGEEIEIVEEVEGVLSLRSR